DFRADDWQPKPYAVANRLREAREAANLQQKELAALLKWDPAKLSKTESGARTAVTADDVRAWAQATGMSDRDRDTTIGMLAQYKAAEKSWRDRMKTGRQAVQLEYARLYRDSTLFRIFQLAWVPGILQTPDYARQIFEDLNDLDPDTPRNVEADVQTRMARREYLYDLGKHYEIIISESVLRDVIVEPDVMRAQLARLETVTDLPNVRFGILPFGRRRHTAAQIGFAMYDDLAVVEDYVIDTPYHGEAAKRYAKVMDRFWSEAVEGDDAVQLIRAAAAALHIG
ncbi:helix-turn-helix domain-containing protein, partial [Paractinoplanes toevensis]|uniref:helix-turn-helix domain-containing protein n=1 Tax=Paractinoplanes toevensis TaxID=571911 RepID=UPI001BB3871B